MWERNTQGPNDFTTEPLAKIQVRAVLVDLLHCGRRGAFCLRRGRLLGSRRCCLFFLVNVKTKSRSNWGTCWS